MSKRDKQPKEVKHLLKVNVVYCDNCGIEFWDYLDNCPMYNKVREPTPIPEQDFNARFLASTNDDENREEEEEEE